eukprot:scaffold4024_cov222-Pinguiococcus_pyrenoidosus.AAC.2
MSGDWIMYQRALLTVPYSAGWLFMPYHDLPSPRAMPRLRIIVKVAPNAERTSSAVLVPNIDWVALNSAIVASVQWVSSVFMVSLGQLQIRHTHSITTSTEQ